MTFNFNPGPAALPKEVLEKVQAEFLDFRGVGYSIAEASHRSPEFKEVIDGAEALLRELLDIPAEYAVLFLQGGASSQFFMVPMNLLGTGGSADYADSGSWSVKAIKEAQRFGKVNVVASSKAENYTCIPEFDTADCDPNAAYLHITSNNTIAGTQYALFPRPPAGVPLITDASSDILSRRIELRDFGLIYAGAQKNLGPSGVTLVIIRKDLAERSPEKLPTMLNYNTHIEKESTFNTPPTFAIYMVNLVAEWVKAQGGLAAIEKLNNEKAAMLYAEIDADDFYRGSAKMPSRSKMNVCFNLATEELEQAFIAEAKKSGLIGLKGHRSVGGVRASIYNAMPLAGVRQLTDFMREFRRTRG